MFFKHKYITELTLIPEDIMVRAIMKLRDAIQRSNDKKRDVNFKAIKKLDSIFHSHKSEAASPRVNAPASRVDDAATGVDFQVPLHNENCQVPRMPTEVDCRVSLSNVPANNTRASAKKRAIEHCT